jgi:hypothetical protein
MGTEKFDHPLARQCHRDYLTYGVEVLLVFRQDTDNWPRVKLRFNHGWKYLKQYKKLRTRREMEARYEIALEMECQYS